MKKKCVRLRGSEKAFLCVLFDQSGQPVYVISDPVGISGLFPVTITGNDEIHLLKMIGELLKIKCPEKIFECIDYNEKNFISKPKMIFKNGLN